MVGTIVGFADQDSRRVEYRSHVGRPGGAEEALERVLDGKSTLKQEFDRMEDRYPAVEGADGDVGVLRDSGTVFERGIRLGAGYGSGGYCGG